jgi:signal transduction histidine kinase
MRILSAEIRRYLFTKNGTENESGSGIGLKLVNEFVKLMGGELKINSSPGQGSTFLFTLPGYDVKKNPTQHESYFKQTIN